jgi:hypothetical protein
MIPRNVSPANLIVRTTLSEVAVLRLLRAAIAADPKNAVALCDGVIADFKAGVNEYVVIGNASRDPKAQKALEALPGAVDAMVKEIEALKPKA